MIAKNYLAHARVLARSLAEQDPSARLWVLIIDDFAGYIDPAREPFEIITPADIGCEPFDQMAVWYSVLELSTAVKPWLLRYLLAETNGPVTYLDPDIKAFLPLTRLDELADRHGVVLIPHNNEPVPFDGCRPTQIDIMIAGVYNLGYVSVASRPEVDRLLDWWADRLRRDCRVDPQWGYFVDQRWFDLAPGLLTDVAIVREPEYNVAYWNLFNRRLGHDGTQYLVNDRPLAFFHFSGFDPQHPLVLSRHQNRIDVAAEPMLERLLAEYAAEVMAEDHALSRDWPYGFAALADGTVLDRSTRALYDEYAESENGEALSPFTIEGVRRFEAWLREPAPGTAPSVNRVLARVYAERTDLQAAYPNISGRDGPKLAQWAEDYGRKEIPLLAKIGIDGRAAAGRVGHGGAIDRQPGRAGGSGPMEPWGVNLVGPFQSELQGGRRARVLLDVLDSAGIPALPVHSQTVGGSEEEFPFLAAEPDEAAFPVNLICLGPESLPEFAKQAGEGFFAARFSVGLWAWPLSEFPEEWRERFTLVDEIWVPSEHTAAALAGRSCPVTTVPLWAASSTPPAHSRDALGWGEGDTVFLAHVDLLEDVERQNPDGVIEAFTRTFEAGSGAKLAIACEHAQRGPEAQARLQALADGHPDVHLLDDPPRDALALCECFVSLHRAVAFGSAIAAAMAAGKPAIATAYSGNLDYMTAENGYLVDHSLAEIGAGHDPYPASARWAEPDLDHAARLMREVFDAPDQARARGARAASDIAARYSVAAVGELIGRRLESIRGTATVRPAASRSSEIAEALGTLPLKVRQGPRRVPLTASRLPARRFVRTALLRLMAPFTGYQQSVNSQLVESLERVVDELAAVRREAAAERGRLLAQLRQHARTPPSS